MAETTVLIPDTGTKKAHFWDRSIGGNTVLDEFVIPGEYPYASYTATANGLSTATSGADLMQLMAGASLNLFVRRIEVQQQAAAGAVAPTVIQIVRLTSAGTGGTVVTPRRAQLTDAASGATAMTLPTAQGATSDIYYNRPLWLGTAAIPILDYWVWEARPNSKGLFIAAGVTNGIVLNLVTGVATSTVTVNIDFVEVNFT
ncbi:MAG TPA: hypothetical protein VGQ02_10830 [Candidatus Limnocylindrales bacterium]|jgi:hypothetical protein|nr:hypothetical protein [Candidatus Limnocylindrales bacterium]